jgi:superfamily II DNA or RNA helicase
MKKPDYSWQQRCTDKILTTLATGGRDFAVDVTPRAGKTKMAVQTAAAMFDNASIALAVVVVPNEVVRGQFAAELEAGGIPAFTVLDGRDFANLRLLGPGDMKAIVLTTGMLARVQHELERLLSRYRTLFIADEVHHMAISMTWGDALVKASSGAVFRIGLSGTVYRQDNNAIAFLRYENGESVPSFRFTHDDALKARLVPALSFRTVGGFITLLDTQVSKEPVRYSFDDGDYGGGNEPLERRRMSYMLSIKSPFIGKMLREADKELAAIQASHPAAAGIVYAHGIKQAERIATYLRETRKRKVRLVVDDASAEAEVAAFNESSEDWIVQIRKVYEGSTISRLRVGCYLTKVMTPGFMDQAFKRTCTLVPELALEEQTAIIFIADDDRLVEIAKGLGEVRPHVIVKEDDPEVVTDGWPPTDDDDDDRDVFDDDTVHVFEILDSDVGLRRAIVGKVVFTAEQVAEAEAYFDAKPEAASWTTSQKMEVWALLKSEKFV